MRTIFVFGKKNEFKLKKPVCFGRYPYCKENCTEEKKQECRFIGLEMG